MTKKIRTAGRPPKGPHKGNQAAFSIRARPELLLKLDQEAHAAGKSRSQHIQNLLFSTSEPDRRPDIPAIVEAFAMIIENVERATGLEWHKNAFTSAAIARGVQGLLSYFSGKGELTVPAKLEKDAAALEQKPPTTPDEVGADAWMLVVYDVEVAALRDWEAIGKMFVRKGQETVPTVWFKHAQLLRDLGSRRQPQSGNET